VITDGSERHQTGRDFPYSGIRAEARRDELNRLVRCEPSDVRENMADIGPLRVRTRRIAEHESR
jgi:hypothetical protein